MHKFYSIERIGYQDVLERRLFSKNLENTHKNISRAKTFVTISIAQYIIKMHIKYWYKEKVIFTTNLRKKNYIEKIYYNL